MTLDEARAKVQISQEERDAVKRYCSFYHTTMNLFAEFNLEKYIILYEKPWSLPGKGDTNSNRVQNAIERIEDFVRVYSTMIKYSERKKTPYRLYRGGSVNEAKNLRVGDTYDILVSTSTDDTTAKSFAEPGEGKSALIEIVCDDKDYNIPFLDVNDFLSYDERGKDEQEFIISPFTEIKSFRHRSDYNGFKYYDLELGAPKLKEFREGEKENYESTIKEEFYNVIELGKRYRELNYEYDRNWNRYKVAKEKEEIDDCWNRCTEISNEQRKIKSVWGNFSSVLKKYIQGRCVEKQREYIEARNVVEKAEEEAEKKAEKLAREDARQRKISDNSSVKHDCIDNLSRTLGIMDTEFGRLKSQRDSYKDLCEKIGVTFCDDFNSETFRNNIGEAKSNISRIDGKIRAVDVDENSSLEEASDICESLGKYSAISRQINEIASKLSGTVDEYGRIAETSLKREVDRKVQELMKQARLQILQRKKQEVEHRRLPFLFGRFKQKKLKALELENLNLQIDYERTKPFFNKKRYSIRDSISDLFGFSMTEMDGQATPEMSEFYDKVAKAFRMDRNQIKDLAIQKNNNKPIPILDEKTATKIERLQFENEDYRQKIQQNNRDMMCNENFDISVNRSALEFSHHINQILRVTESAEEHILDDRGPKKDPAGTRTFWEYPDDLK